MELENKIGFVVSGKYRQEVLDFLESTNFSTPSDLSSELGCSDSQISRTVSALAKRNLISCKTPERHKGRLYEITEEGQKVLNEVKNNE